MDEEYLGKAGKSLGVVLVNGRREWPSRSLARTNGTFVSNAPLLLFFNISRLSRPHPSPRAAHPNRRAPHHYGRWPTYWVVRPAQGPPRRAIPWRRARLRRCEYRRGVEGSASAGAQEGVRGSQACRPERGGLTGDHLAVYHHSVACSLCTLESLIVSPTASPSPSLMTFCWFDAPPAIIPLET